MSISGYNIRNSIAVGRSKISFSTKSFVYQPDPYTIGSSQRGAQLKNGLFLFVGHLIESPDTSIWDINIPNSKFEKELHGFCWLDDLAADGSKFARDLVKEWFWEWVDKYGNGSTWTPQLTGRRVVRIINHSQLILSKASTQQKKIFFKLLGQQTNFLFSRYKSETSNLKRLEALNGLIYCSGILRGKKYFLNSALRKMSREASRCIDANGNVKTRNPEELFNILAMLSWSASTALKVNKVALKKHQEVMEFLAINIRSLRIGNGGLAHFHGGGRGEIGYIDQILSGIVLPISKIKMNSTGYYRIFKNRTVLIMDVGEQFMKSNSNFSASSFELSTGYEELIVNSGPGALFGDEWSDISQTLHAHSGVCVANVSPSNRRTKLIPKAEYTSDLNAEIILSSHGGYTETHGVIHNRKIRMSSDGCVIFGLDTICSESAHQRDIFDKWIKSKNENSMPFSAQFHIAPDVEIKWNNDNTKIILETLKGIIWVFEVLNGEISIQDSAFMQFGELSPRAAKQVVVSGTAIDYQGNIEWKLTKH